MEKKVVAKKKKNKTRKNRVSRKIKVPMPKPEIVFVCGPGKAERTLMFIAKILKVLLRFVEKKIQNLKVRRLAKKMDSDGADKI